MLDDNDAWVARIEYAPYGIMAVALGDVPDVLFTGKPWDEDVQMYAFPYRNYSPASARWLTRDPLGMVDGPNMYAYVMGNPVGRWDALGLGLDDLRDALLCAAAIVFCGLAAGACAADPTNISCLLAVAACLSAIAACQECLPDGEPPPSKDECARLRLQWFDCREKHGQDDPRCKEIFKKMRNCDFEPPKF